MALTTRLRRLACNGKPPSVGLLLMIGFSLVAEGMGFHIPKGYLYAAIGFAIVIETFNQVASANRRSLALAPSSLAPTRCRCATIDSPIGNIIAVVAVLLIHMEIAVHTAPYTNRMRNGLVPTPGIASAV